MKVKCVTCTREQPLAGTGQWVSRQLLLSGAACLSLGGAAPRPIAYGAVPVGCLGFYQDDANIHCN